MHILRGFIYEGYNSCFMGYVPVGFVVCFTCVFLPWVVYWFSLVEWCLYCGYLFCLVFMGVALNISVYKVLYVFIHFKTIRDFRILPNYLEFPDSSPAITGNHRQIILFFLTFCNNNHGVDNI